MAPPTPRLGVVAGEASGDLLAALLLGGLKQRWPPLAGFGIGGPKMAAQGFEAWWPHEKLAVRGYVEVLRHYREISAIREQLAERLIRERPSAFIGVDAPDFNLDLELRLRAAGIKTVHFICPSIWAWRSKRVHKLAQCADHVLCLFPFEPELLHRHGVAATYVGHPLADAIPLEVPRAAARRALALSESDEVVAVLPGSRRSEIETIAPVFVGAVQVLHRLRPALRFLLPAAPGLRARIEAMLPRDVLPLQVLDGRSHEALAACDAALVASGTATLEAALFKRPMVIAYRMNPLTWQLMKRMSLQPWVGLPNILCRDLVVPERLQGDARPEVLARDLLAWLDQPSRAEEIQRRFTDLHLELRRDMARTATDAIEQVLNA